MVRCRSGDKAKRRRNEEMFIQEEDSMLMKGYPESKELMERDYEILARIFFSRGWSCVGWQHQLWVQPANFNILISN